MIYPQQQIRPTTLSIITTFRCTAACGNCCFDCHPSRTEKLPIETALFHLDNSVAKFPSLRVVVITGGESFLDVMYLRTVIRHAKTKGLVCRVVTNGFWAKDKKSAFELLSELKSDGLDEIDYRSF